jgi:hypothetical protein
VTCLLLTWLVYFGELTIKSGATLTPLETNGCLVIVARELTIEPGGCLDATGFGHRGGASCTQGSSWTGKGEKSCMANGGGGGGREHVSDFARFGGAGGSFGSIGGRSFGDDIDDSYIGRAGDVYDPFSQLPNTLLGSGGGGSAHTYQGNVNYLDGNGGGAIIIRAHTLINNGFIKSNGNEGRRSGGGGSGGLVLIVADHVRGEGVIQALGGKSGSDFEMWEEILGGRGGDGHIIIRSPDLSGNMKYTPQPKIEYSLDFPDLSTLDTLRRY